MNGVTIRAAVPDDAESIATIHADSVIGERGRGDYDDEQIDAWAHAHTPAQLRERIGPRLFFIAEGVAGPVGYAQLDVDEAIVRSIYVAADQQRGGLGMQLGRTVLAVAAETGLSALELDSSLNAVPFYERLGFERLGGVDHRFRNGTVMACVRMARKIVDERESKMLTNAEALS